MYIVIIFVYFFFKMYCKILLSGQVCFLLLSRKENIL